MPFHPLESPLVSAASGAFAGLAALGIAIAAGSLRRRIATRREANKTRHKLGRPSDSLHGQAPGNEVTLQGTLVMSGKPCTRFEDGTDAAVATARGRFTAVHTRAEHLLLTLADGSVEIKGHVEVLVGSNEAQPGPLEALSDAPTQRIKNATDASHETPSGSLRLLSLTTGDHVVVRGKLVRAETSSRATGYREDAAPWILIGEDTKPVLLAFEGLPQVSGTIKAAITRQRSTAGWGLAAMTCLAIGGALGVAVGANNASRLAEAARAMETSKPAALIGDPKRCKETAAAYAEALKPSQSCAEDNDCTVELRGEQWFDLDGCFRLRNQHLSTADADALAKRWLEQRCVTQYEICTMAPRPMCRNGQCVERPPAPLPETWVRYVFSEQLTFFAPPGLKEGPPMQFTCGPVESLGLHNENLHFTLVLDMYGIDYREEMKEISLGGTIARLRELSPDETRPHGFAEGFDVEVPREAQGKNPLQPTLGSVEGVLHIHARCKTAEDCKDARLILGTIGPI